MPVGALRCVSVLFAVAVLGAVMPSAIGASKTFEHPDKRFVVDLPDGFVQKPQKDESFFVFQPPGGKPIITVIYLAGGNDPGERDLDEVFQLVKKIAAGSEPTALSGSSQRMRLGANRARAGQYTGTLQTDGRIVEVAFFIGAVIVKNGVVGFFAATRGLRTGPSVRDAFYTIRSPGEIVSAPTEVTPATD